MVDGELEIVVVVVVEEIRSRRMSME